MTHRLSLTMRLTILFSLCSAVVLLGLGVLIWLAMDRHFATEDYVVLGDNIRLIEKIAQETPAERLPQRFREMVDHHPGFVAQVQTAQGHKLYATKDFDFAIAFEAIPRELARDNTFVWQQGEQEYRGMRASSLFAVTPLAREAIMRRGASPRRAAHQPKRPLASTANAV